MKYILLLLFSPILFSQGKLEYSVLENQMSFIYNNKDNNFSNRYLIAYFFNDFSNVPEIISAKLNEDNVILDIPNRSVFALFKVRNQTIEDNNFGEFWEWKTKKKVKNKNLRIAKSYLGNNPKSYNRTVDFDKAKSYLEVELKDFPNNIVAKIALLTLQLDLRKFDYTEYGNQLNKALGNWKISQLEEEVAAVSRALKSLNKEDKARKLEYNFATNNPISKLAEEVFISNISEVASASKFNKMCENYFNFFPDSDQNSVIFNAYLSSLISKKQFGKALNSINELINVKPEYYLILASKIRQNVQIQFKLADKTDSTIKALYQTSIDKYKNIVSNNFEEQLNNLNSIAIAHTHFADYLLATKDTTEAFSEFQKSIEITGSNSPDLLIKKIDSLANKIGKPTRVLPNNDWTLKYNQVKAKPFTAILKHTNGEFFDIESKKYKNLVITFYATWCGPCQEMIPTLEELELGFIEDKNTELFVINSWEDPKKRWNDLNGFIEDLEPKFKIIVDETDFIPQKYGVTGLPWTLIIDKNGIIRFSEQGFISHESYIKSIKSKLKFLENENN